MQQGKKVGSVGQKPLSDWLSSWGLENLREWRAIDTYAHQILIKSSKHAQDHSKRTLLTEELTFKGMDIL